MDYNPTDFGGYEILWVVHKILIRKSKNNLECDFISPSEYESILGGSDNLPFVQPESEIEIFEWNFFPSEISFFIFSVFHLTRYAHPISASYSQGYSEFIVYFDHKYFWLILPSVPKIGKICFVPPLF